MSKTLIDLHLHSTYSDGKLTPKQIVKKLAQAKIGFAVLTDHDTVSGVKEFAREAKLADIDTLSGVEISAEECGIGLHILGYGIDIKEARLLNLFKKQQAERKKAFEKRVALFKKAGFVIDPQRYNEYKKIKSVAKTHVFRLLWEVPQNQKLCHSKYGFKKTFSKLGTGGRAPQSEFIESFMDLPGQLAHVNKKSISAEEAVRLIHEIGGSAVWAHPGIETEFKSDETLDGVFKSLLSYGIDGIEVFTSARSMTDARKHHLYKLATKHGLLITIGSDDHDGTRIGKSKVLEKYQKIIIKKLFSKFEINKKHRQAV